MRLMAFRTLIRKKVCLNPYSNGIYSMSDVNQFSMDSFALGLNPYSNGIYSMRLRKVLLLKQQKECLNPYSNGI